MSKTIDELKIEATQLGLSFRSDISAEKLAEKIEAHYTASSAESVVVAKVEVTEAEEAKALEVENTTSFQAYVQKQRREAEKTQIVTIIDNDSRVNNLTTTLTVTASNEYFDLGTVILPLNERVEVRQGHLNVLKELRIPQHIKSAADPSISTMVMRPRYTIQYEQAE